MEHSENMFNFLSTIMRHTQ
nr:unnamed protein product [Callosobruchus analis]CAI5869754.1 unnamed protein product [Callosobruchus analis]